MLEVTFLPRRAATVLPGFSAHGHADFDEHGKDIVCAAVSAVLQAARLGLEHTMRPRRARGCAGGPANLDSRCAEAVSANRSIAAIVETAELAAAEDRAALSQARAVRPGADIGNG